MEGRERNKTRLQDLPDEVILLIFQGLEPLSLFVISLVCLGIPAITQANLLEKDMQTASWSLF